MPKPFEDRIDDLQLELRQAQHEAEQTEDPAQKARLTARVAALRRSIRWYQSRLGSRHAQEAWLSARRADALHA